MTVRNDGLGEVTKLARLHVSQSISDDEFCENVILRMVHADQADWPGMLNATGSVGIENLKSYCERVDISNLMPLYEALMVPNVPPEDQREKREHLRSIYGRLSAEILNKDHRSHLEHFFR